MHYYFADQIGSANVVTNATGAMPPEQDIEYHPYGEQQVYADTLGQQYKFTGHEHDTETNNDYFGARYYSSAFGRFLTPDWAATPVPIPYAVMGNPQTLNLYSYVQNNPITSADPDGHGDKDGSGAASCDQDCQTKRKEEAKRQQEKEEAQRTADEMASRAGGAVILPRKPFIPPAPFLKPNRIYRTRDQAGAAAARADQSGQKKTGAEYGALVFRVGSAGYTYTDPVTQGQTRQVDPFNTTGVPQTKPVDYSLAPIPLGMPLAAETHSHPDMNGFSGNDIERAHLMTAEGLHHAEFGAEYLGQPDGTVIKYDPHTGTQTVFPSGEPK